MAMNIYILVRSPESFVLNRTYLLVTDSLFFDRPNVFGKGKDISVTGKSFLQHPTRVLLCRNGELENCFCDMQIVFVTNSLDCDS